MPGAPRRSRSLPGHAFPTSGFEKPHQRRGCILSQSSQRARREEGEIVQADYLRFNSSAISVSSAREASFPILFILSKFLFELCLMRAGGRGVLGSSFHVRREKPG